MTSPETLETYRKMSIEERFNLVVEMTKAASKALCEGPPEVVNRRFEILRMQNDDRNRRMLETLAKFGDSNG